MLKNTFHHIPGIGSNTEKQLWSSGLTHWNKFKEPFSPKLSIKRVEIMTQYIQESSKYLENNDPNYFADLLPSNLHWRFFPEFRNSTAYIDIETTGLEAYCSEITTIAIYDGKSTFYYVQGDNLDDFPLDIKKYKVLVTYNGKSFDIPFIESYFEIKLNHAHIDLRYVLKSLGYSGGLKGCEKKLGINRGSLEGVDGYFAVLLWKDFIQNSNQKALETLLAYNIEDVVNLEALMVMAYNMKIKDTPFMQDNKLATPNAPDIPFKADIATIEKIKSKIFSSPSYEFY
jgi:uncharacterized protein YprB with RNaseH-like and TPR domain